MKYLDYILVLTLIAASIGAVLVFMMNRTVTPITDACPKDALMCEDGTVRERTGPDCTFPECPKVSPSVPADIQALIDAKKDLIVLDTPHALETISSPLTLTGEARGFWFFEASFPITIVDWDGRIIGEGYATADDEWMTTDFVPFTATVSFDLPTDTPYRRGAIILRKDNPSGLPEHDDALEIPITF